MIYLLVLSASDTTGKEKWKQIKQQTKEQYLSMLYFDGLNRNTYGYLYNEVYKAHWLNRCTAKED